MSRVKRVAVVAACAIGVSTVMITPASAVVTVTYDCGAYGNPVTVVFERVNGDLDLTAAIPYTSPFPVAAGKASVT